MAGGKEGGVVSDKKADKHSVKSFRFGYENIIHFSINYWNHYWSIAHSGH
jgi:hypothetical protein